ncbi:MAG: hypothetical protein ABEJ97_06765 [Halobellus sp.]
MSAETPRLGVAHPTVVPGQQSDASDADEGPADGDADRSDEPSA